MKIGIDAVDNSRLHDACCWKEFSDTTRHTPENHIMIIFPKKSHHDYFTEEKT